MKLPGDRGRPGGRGASSVVGIALLVGITIILALTIATFLLANNPGAVGPQADFQAAYDERGGGVTITHQSGDPIEARNVRVEVDDTVARGSWGNDTIDSGVSYTALAAPGQTVEVVWDAPKKDQTAVLFDYEVPEGTLELADWNRKARSDSAEDLTDAFVPVVENDQQWVTRSDSIGWKRVSGPTQYQWKYGQRLPTDAGSVTVDLNLEVDSFEDSGIRIYAVATDGTEYDLWCDEAENQGDSPFGCSDEGASYSWTGTKTATDPSGIAAVYIDARTYENTADGDTERLKKIEITTS